MVAKTLPFGLAEALRGRRGRLFSDRGRIQVTGNSGSGKTTFAARLAKALDAEFVDLDALNWEPGWTALNESDPDELERRFRAATAGERWVASGSYMRLCQRTFWPRKSPFGVLLAGDHVVMRVWRP